MPKEVQDEMAKNNKFRLVSIRSLDEFEGKKSGYDYIKRAGEPKGAVWGHDEDAYRNADGTFISFDKAVALWKEQGVTKDNEIAFYCGTGWRATIPFLMAYENGWTNVKLYDGGWFVWQMDEKLPIQTITPEAAAAQYK
jgi:thiosulfate/3-mercaptopyruvate sulfurtransferase